MNARETNGLVNAAAARRNAHPSMMARFALLGLAIGGIAPAQAPAELSDLPVEYAFAPSGEALTEKELAGLEHGKIMTHLADMPDTAVKKATTIALAGAPPEAVFAVLTDYEEFPRFMPYCKKVRLERREGEESWVRFHLDFPWPVGNRHYVVKVTDRREDLLGTPVLTSRWIYEPGTGNINDTYGSWEVLPYPGERSFLRYTVFGDLGGRIPRWVRNVAAKVVAPKVIKGLRKRVEDDSP